jgi:hypothetical protein
VPDTAIPMPDLPTDEQCEELMRIAAELSAAFQQIAAALAPVAQVLAEQVTQTYAALQATGYLDKDGKPTRPVDRPAWQSPYGPPTRHH